MLTKISSSAFDGSSVRELQAAGRALGHPSGPFWALDVVSAEGLNDPDANAWIRPVPNLQVAVIESTLRTGPPPGIARGLQCCCPRPCMMRDQPSEKADSFRSTFPKTRNPFAVPNGLTLSTTSTTGGRAHSRRTEHSGREYLVERR